MKTREQILELDERILKPLTSKVVDPAAANMVLGIRMAIDWVLERETEGSLDDSLKRLDFLEEISQKQV